MSWLQSAKVKWQKRHKMLTQQELLVGELVAIMTTIAGLKDDRPKRVSLYASLLFIAVCH